MEVTVSRGSFWWTGKSTELNRLVSRKENTRGQKSQPLELCAAPRTGSRWRSIPASGENLLHGAKLLFSHRPSLKTIPLEISHHKSMKTSGENVLGTRADLYSRQPASSWEGCQIGYYCSCHRVPPCFTVMLPYSLSSFLAFLPYLLPTNADSKA